MNKSGRIADASEFNGTSSREITQTDSSHYDFAGGSGEGPYSIAFWINSTDGSTDDIINHRDSTQGWQVEKRSNGSIRFTIYQDTPTVVQYLDGGNINDGNWHYVAIVRGTAGVNASIFIDGVLNSTRATSKLLTDNPSQDLIIGTAWSGGGAALTAHIDELSLWNVTLTNENVTYLYNLYLDEDDIICSNATTARTVTRANFTKCDSGNIALNVSFQNETGTQNNVNATIDTNIELNLSNLFVYNYTNTTYHQYHLFCLDPNNLSFFGNGTAYFEADGSPQRQYYLNRSLRGDTIYNLTLYLLGTADGIYTTFQVFDSINQPISSVYVRGESQISGSFYKIGSGLTDASGSITMWVNPDNAHRFTFSRAGYDTYTTTITPTQSVYTITMTSTSTLNESSYSRGMLYEILPTDSILNNNTLYNFSYNLSSSILNLTTYGFSIIGQNGTVLTNQVATNTTGGFLNATIDTSNYTSFDLEYYWEVNGVYMNGTRTYSIMTIYQGDYSLLSFFDDLRGFTGSGMNDFTRALFAFVLILIITATVTFVAGVYSPLGILGLITGLTWFFNIVGLIPTIGIPLVGSYLISIFMTLILGAFVILEYIK
jgi:hypothetical protein